MTNRASHSKSRKGCVDCKRRKVKCDEVHPVCGNCQRRKASCSFVHHHRLQHRPKALQPLAPESSSSSPTQSSSSEPLDPATLTRLSIVSDPERASRPLSEPWLRDLELMHHFSTSTCYSLAQRRDVQHVWQDVIPHEAYRHRFVMHGLLAVAALHKAHLLGPHRGDALINISAHHQSLGLRDFTPCLTDISKDNWRPIYCFSSMVILYVCCLPMRSANTPSSTISALLELFACVRGLQSILSPFLPHLLTTRLSPIIQSLQGLWADHTGESFSEVQEGETLIPDDTIAALQSLGRFLDGHAPDELKGPYGKAVDELVISAKLIGSASVQVESSMVFYWLYAVPSDILPQLRSLEPCALLLLSYYCVFLAIGERHFWFLSSWSHALLAEIEHCLNDSEQYQLFLSWPRRYV